MISSPSLHNYMNICPSDIWRCSSVGEASNCINNVPRNRFGDLLRTRDTVYHIYNHLGDIGRQRHNSPLSHPLPSPSQFAIIRTYVIKLCIEHVHFCHSIFIFVIFEWLKCVPFHWKSSSSQWKNWPMPHLVYWLSCTRVWYGMLFVILWWESWATYQAVWFYNHPPVSQCLTIYQGVIFFKFKVRHSTGSKWSINRLLSNSEIFQRYVLFFQAYNNSVIYAMMPSFHADLSF